MCLYVVCYLHCIVLEPLLEVMSPHGGLSFENCQRDGPFGDWRALGLLRNDKTARQSGVFDHLVAQKLSESLGRRDGRGFLSLVLGKGFGHALVLGDQVKKFRVRHVGTL